MQALEAGIDRIEVITAMLGGLTVKIRASFRAYRRQDTDTEGPQ